MPWQRKSITKLMNYFNVKPFCKIEASPRPPSLEGEKKFDCRFTIPAPSGGGEKRFASRFTIDDSRFIYIHISLFIINHPELCKIRFDQPFPR